jgi:hypothetical protein
MMAVLKETPKVAKTAVSMVVSLAASLGLVMAALTVEMKAVERAASMVEM